MRRLAPSLRSNALPRQRSWSFYSCILRCPSPAPARKHRSYDKANFIEGATPPEYS
jgi:hypothetical protein